MGNKPSDIQRYRQDRYNILHTSISLFYMAIESYYNTKGKMVVNLEMWKAYHKIIKVIDSCVDEEHLDPAWVMIELFESLYSSNKKCNVLTNELKINHNSAWRKFW